MMVSWHNWKLKLKRYWFSVWCWWSKWKDASWSQCNFPGRSTEDPGRSKSGVAAPQDIPTSYTCSKCNFTTQKAEDTPTTSSSGVPDARAKPGWGIILHFFKELLFWCCLHVWFLLFVCFCLTFYFAVFEEAPIGPCAPRLALSQMVSPGVFNYKILSSKPFQWLFSRAHGGVLSHKAVREKIVNVFLIEEQKIVKKVPEALGKNKEAKWDF